MNKIYLLKKKEINIKKKKKKKRKVRELPFLFPLLEQQKERENVSGKEREEIKEKIIEFLLCIFK